VALALPYEASSSSCNSIHGKKIVVFIVIIFIVYVFEKKEELILLECIVEILSTYCNDDKKRTDIVCLSCIFRLIWRDVKDSSCKKM
jgi:hypothetical protein